MLGNLAREAPAKLAAVCAKEAPILEATGITKHFIVQGCPHTVFDAFDFSVEAGSFVSIVGPSGCGKSTLLKLMAGLESANGGEVRFKNKRVQQPPRGVIFVVQ